MQVGDMVEDTTPAAVEVFENATEDATTADVRVTRLRWELVGQAEGAVRTTVWVFGAEPEDGV